MSNEQAVRTAAFLVVNEGSEQVETTEPWRCIDLSG
jgi:hypothetical protein